MELGRGLIFGLAFSFVRIFWVLVLHPQRGPIVVKITNLVIFHLSFMVIFRKMRVGIVSLWIRIKCLLVGRSCYLWYYAFYYKYLPYTGVNRVYANL